MDIVPVIDLKNGQVVHAHRGDRERYFPIQSTLTKESTPLAILATILELYPFERIYLADIDAIMGGSFQQGIYASIRHAYPSLEIWLDAGFRSINQLDLACELGLRPVLGSESLDDFDQYQMLFTKTPSAILSLDYKKGVFQGPQRLLETPKAWPNEIVVMILDKVGSFEGHDEKRLIEIQKLAPKHRIYAAGGIRNEEDIHQLEAHNIYGALVASAIHDKRIVFNKKAHLG
jgi:phosphoribosylformimino-5-aminoimidazole carboxamide ribotide isomerase